MAGTVTIQAARSILGTLAGTMTDQHINSLLAQDRILVSSFLDNYERTIYGGKTLAEIAGSITH